MLKHPNIILFAGLLGLVISLLGNRLFQTNLVVGVTIPPSDFERLNSFAGPLRVSQSNPRYFTDNSGRLIYLTGSHTWANFQDIGYSNPPPTFDYEGYLDFLHANSHNFFRLWVWEQARGAPWSEDIWVAPLPYQRSGTTAALDGEPKFDLTKFDQAYFDRLRDRVVKAEERGIYVSIMLFDGFSVGHKNPGDPGNPWFGHPFNASNNANGINGDPNGDGNGYETQDLSINAITTLQEAYVRKVVDTLNDLDNVLFEICNECGQDSTEWQYHMINFIHDYESLRPKQHAVGMTVEYPNGDNADLFASPAEWISPNDYSDPPAADGNKVIIADTDHIWGIGGDRQWVWKSFTRGVNPIFMDCYNSNYCEGANPNDPTWVSVRLNMGYTRAYANRMDWAAMVPHGELCSTGYCLANPIGEGAEYLVYLPNGGSVNVDLSDSLVQFSVEWFDPQHGTVVDAPKMFGGVSQTFFAPFSGDAVLYIYHSGSSSSTPIATSTPMLPSSTPIQTSTPPRITETSSASASPSPTSEVPSTPFFCTQGFLILSGLFFVLRWIIA